MAGGFTLVTFGILNARRGTPLHLVPLGATPFTAAVDTRAGRVFVGTTQGVSVLDVTSSRVPRTLDERGSADSLAVDSGSGRLMAASGNGSVRIFDTRTGLLMHTTLLPSRAS